MEKAVAEEKVILMILPLNWWCGMFHRPRMNSVPLSVRRKDDAGPAHHFFLAMHIQWMDSPHTPAFALSS